MSMRDVTLRATDNVRARRKRKLEKVRLDSFEQSLLDANWFRPEA